MDSEGDVVMLMENDQLRKLATLLLHLEEPFMERIKSEPERVKYLNECNAAYDKVVSLLDEGDDFSKKFEGVENKREIVKDIRDYIKYAINMSMQSVKNLSMRVSCIDKIKTHFNSLVTEVEKLDPENLSALRLLAEDVSMYKQAMLEYTNNCISGSARAMSKNYSMVIKQEGITFGDLVDRQKIKLGYEGEFESLEDAQKLEVYNGIIEESGRAKIPKRELAGAGVGMFLVGAGLMVWDIFTAEQVGMVLLNNALVALTKIGQFAVQVVEEAVFTVLVDAEIGVLYASIASFMAVTLVGLVFAVATGFLIDYIISSGGKVPPSMENIKFHTAKMPDGMALANQIAQDGF